MGGTRRRSAKGQQQNEKGKPGKSKSKRSVETIDFPPEPPPSESLSQTDEDIDDTVVLKRHDTNDNTVLKGKTPAVSQASSGSSAGCLLVVALLLVLFTGAGYVFFFGDVGAMMGEESIMREVKEAAPLEDSNVEKIPDLNPETISDAGLVGKPADNSHEVPEATQDAGSDEVPEATPDVRPDEPSDAALEDSPDTSSSGDKKKVLQENAQQNVDSPSPEPKTSKTTTSVHHETEVATEQAKEPVPPKRPAYINAHITNKADNKIRAELDEADDLLQKDLATKALKMFDSILLRYPNSPRATYGHAQALDRQSELQQSNSILEQCIDVFLKVFELSDVPKELMLKAGRRAANRQSFRGWGFRGAKTLRRLIELYPEEDDLWNDLGVQHLMVGRNEDARLAFTEKLRKDPSNAYAKVHMGFILKTVDNKFEEAVPLLKEAIESGEPATIDGRFFFHLGDAQFRLGHHDEAYNTYALGAEKGLFRSTMQRSLYNVDTLKGRPWWTLRQTGNEKLLKELEDNWEIIRDEGLANLDPKLGAFLPEEENLRETGDWKQFSLFARGRMNEANCKRAPRTCALISGYRDAAGCRRGQVKFSVMHPGVHVWPHCGPTNCRIRSHLGLVVPPGCCEIRVTNDTRTWQEGKVIVFDDSFEHEVWHKGDSLRMVLIVDLWHPDLTPRERETLSAI